MSEWRPIPGFEGYEATNDGRIRSLDRVVRRCTGGTQFYPGRELKPDTGKYGHHAVQLCKSGRVYKQNVHGLVLMTFVGPRPPGMLACHWDGNPDNNHVSNLYWGTYKQNAADMLRHGNNVAANKTHCVRGHEFSPENIRWRNGTVGVGPRICIACVNIRNAARPTMQTSRKRAA